MHLWVQKTKSVPLSYEELKCQAITVPNLMTVDWWSELSYYLKQTGRQLFQLLLKLIPDLRQTLALFVLQFQFLRFARENLHSTRRKKENKIYLCLQFCYFFQVTQSFGVSAQSKYYDTFFAASSCSLRISEPFSRISFSLSSSEELRWRERSAWPLPEGVGPARPPPSSLDCGTGSRSTKLDTVTTSKISEEPWRFIFTYISEWIIDSMMNIYSLPTLSCLLNVVGRTF